MHATMCCLVLLIITVPRSHTYQNVNKR